EWHFPRFLRLVDAAGDAAGTPLLYDLWNKDNAIERDEGNDYRVVPGREHFPVTLVTWYGARFFCQSHGKRLPTADDGEAAARGFEDRRYPWGDALPRCGEVLVPFDKWLPTSQPVTCDRAKDLLPIGSWVQDVTPEGIRDLGGSVGEWVDATFVASSRAS